MDLELGEGWSIRDLRPDDRDRLVELADNRAVADRVADRFPHPYTRDDADAWLAQRLADDPATHFAIALDDGFAGGIGFKPQSDVYRRSVELGYWLGEPYWGRGVATRAVRAIVSWIFARRDVVRVFAGVFETNRASARVLEKAGFVLEGRLRRAVTKRGRTFDLLLYATVRETREAAGERDG